MTMTLTEYRNMDLDHIEWFKGFDAAFAIKNSLLNTPQQGVENHAFF